jgi:hypothetical protein
MKLATANTVAGYGKSWVSGVRAEMRLMMRQAAGLLVASRPSAARPHAPTHPRTLGAVCRAPGAVRLVLYALRSLYVFFVRLESCAVAVVLCGDCCPTFK